MADEVVQEVVAHLISSGEREAARELLQRHPKSGGTRLEERLIGSLEAPGVDRELLRSLPVKTAGDLLENYLNSGGRVNRTVAEYFAYFVEQGMEYSNEGLQKVLLGMNSYPKGNLYPFLVEKSDFDPFRIRDTIFLWSKPSRLVDYLLYERELWRRLKERSDSPQVAFLTGSFMHSLGVAAWEKQHERVVACLEKMVHHASSPVARELLLELLDYLLQ